MKELFIENRFSVTNSILIDRANSIIAGYMEAGYVITLRQLYYQFVKRNYLLNTAAAYKNFGETISKARLAGLVDWDAMEDRTRNLLSIANYASPVDFLDQQIGQYAEPLWNTQPYYCELWVEKEALSGIVSRPCNRLRVPFFSCRGYGSQSEMYVAGKRLAQKIEQGKKIIIFHLGDHDPSGLDMTRDNDERLNMFAGGSVGVLRLGLNMEQINELKPPPNPAKISDSRSEKYIAEFGHDSWELDALDPEYLDNLVGTNIELIIDKPAMSAAAAVERNNKADLRTIQKRYSAALNAAKLASVGEKLAGIKPNQDVYSAE